MNKTEKKKRAQDLIMQHLSIIGYGDAYEEFAEKVGGYEEADKILIQQMNRVAKIMGYKNAWFS